METPDYEHGRVYFKQFGAERVNFITIVSFSKIMQTVTEKNHNKNYRILIVKGWGRLLMIYNRRVGL